MILLTNCMAGPDDEGGIKVARKLLTGIRQKYPEAELYTYDADYPQSDGHMKLNKLMLNLRLAKLLHKSKENLLYAPQFARMLPMSIRVFVLSLYVQGRVNVLLPMCFPPGKIARTLLKLSDARLFVLSRDSWEMMRKETKNEIHYIRAGVDMKRFHPVDEERKNLLRQKYGFLSKQRIVLHVGHLTTGRNVGTMLRLSEQYQAVIVTSTQTRSSWDGELVKQMQSDRTSLRLIDQYLPNIEEIYQLSDVYFFPVLMAGRCIDSPLSVFEAAACDLPIVTTAFGEVKQLVGKEGIYILDSMDEKYVDAVLEKAIQHKKGARQSVIEYDWQFAIAQILELIGGGYNERYS